MGLLIVFYVYIMRDDEWLDDVGMTTPLLNEACEFKTREAAKAAAETATGLTYFIFERLPI